MESSFLGCFDIWMDALSPWRQGCRPSNTPNVFRAFKLFPICDLCYPLNHGRESKAETVPNSQRKMSGSERLRGLSM